MRKFTSVHDVPDPAQWLWEVKELKQTPYAHKKLGENKVLGLIFLNPSLRTRMSTQRAAYNLGMQVMVLNMGQDSWQLEWEQGTIMDGAAQEHVKEAVNVISQYCDIIGVRSFPGLQNRETDYHEMVLNKFIQHSKVPVLSLESATKHPLQGFADLLTIEEYKKKQRPKVVLSWAPHPKALPQAVPNSFVEWMQAGEVDLVITHPEGYELDPAIVKDSPVEYRQDKAFEGADFIYAKNWSSYQEYGKILSKDPAWTITEQKMALTNSAHFMHCLPIRRNVIATDAVVDNSIVIPQAENRLWTAQLVLKKMLESL
ncbi:N-acetylornithine carbamoyltransferase [Cesiribacter sp. SM1]|uniref:N-acetylornithine carbamoyltransferase n=1 Tax=Cesiribacter sp. SM1 TaxID=2861196 RepID=UPI001CD7164E|nr:N-acetylornithine carbamoyltransferase [Cesiribacter sp. SM1]